MAGQRTRVAVLGLDGVSYTLLKHLFRSNVMPRLEQAAGAGAFLRMTTSLPPVSSVAWTSFMTGANPGRHGIFGFTDVRPGEIALHLPSFDDIRCSTIWQNIPHKNTVIVNLPFTYPARPLNGVLIAGFVAPIFERSVYPQRLLPWLKSRQYRTDVDSVRGRQDRRGLMGELFDTLNMREEVMFSLMESEPWDLFIGVITGTDRLHHFFFDACWDETHPYHHDFVEYYRRLDAFFGRFVDRIGHGTRLVVLSDHGFTHLQTQVYLNHILRSKGYLWFIGPDPKSLEDIHPESLAFAMDPSRIYLNCRDRFRPGALGPREATEFRTRLKNELSEMRLGDVGINDPSGQVNPEGPLFSEVLLKEDMYQGDLLHMAPDLLVIPRPGFDVKATVGVSEPVMNDIFRGMHTHDDAFLMIDDPDVATRLPKPDITDTAALILEALH